MTEQKKEAEHDPLSEEEIERANGEPLPDREAMSVITPHVDPPGFTLPIERPVSE
jgi:hypothetical protein